MLHGPTSEDRTRAVLVVRRHARDRHDEAELIAMLGLDQAEPAPSGHRPPGALSVTELHDMLAPFAAEHGRRPGTGGQASPSIPGPKTS